ncbi:LysR family transcriptional regulator [Clostridium sp. cel8]|uniref:LysR substrate-binding domain-containing protein n=1 Tax=unclassified Clostridium TaxID=2614128 RepID=UPI0015F71981|nr:LysR substrate-binding domain-containing protein [Clostridium sp. cel8]MBA5850168.1 LysR family transcriptional regulator [Clostridium sp. cel8]
MLDIKLLTFITVAKTKNYTKSAEILNITQPAVSQHIKYLEDEYGVHLIKRNGREFELTEEGLILLKYAEEIESLYSAVKMRLKNKSGIIRTYNVGASKTIGGYVLPQVIAKYKRMYPNIHILLQVNNTEEILEKLLSGKLDFALVEGMFDKNKFKFKKLKDDELVLAVSPESDFARKKQVDIEEILSGDLILREKGSGTRKILEDKLMKIGYNLNNSNGYMEIGSISAIKLLIESNLGYSIISRETIKKELEQNTIREVKIKGVNILREFNFVYLREEEFMNSFIEFCMENINKYQ